MGCSACRVGRVSVGRGVRSCRVAVRGSCRCARALRPWPDHGAIRSDNDPATRVVDPERGGREDRSGNGQRFRRVGGDLRLLIVAEDWCPDSVHTVPYVAALAARAGVDMRIVDRGSGSAIMKRHPAPDGRGVTPIVVLLRRGIDVGAWVERPSVLQSLFQSIGTNSENARQFAQRQAWYKADSGRTTVAEVVALAEQNALAK